MCRRPHGHDRPQRSMTRQLQPVLMFRDQYEHIAAKKMFSSDDHANAAAVICNQMSNSRWEVVYDEA